jgi:hypothetical protein
MADVVSRNEVLTIIVGYEKNCGRSDLQQDPLKKTETFDYQQLRQYEPFKSGFCKAEVEEQRKPRKHQVLQMMTEEVVNN